MCIRMQKVSIENILNCVGCIKSLMSGCDCYKTLLPLQLRETDAELGRGSRLLTGMILRSIQQRLVLVAVVLTLIIVACFVVYYSFKTKS